MNLMSVPLALIAGLHLTIGLYVYRCAPKSGQNRAFAFIGATTSFWTVGLGLTHYHGISHTWALRLAFASASLMPLGILAFVYHLAPSNNRKLLRRVFNAAGVAFCLMSFTPA